ncbi:MAG: CARDB domain-containing protein [Lachnospiraceae bacterium]|nr:CARDB domain-containing protein [Lachnospiraceae bacterium]
MKREFVKWLAAGTLGMVLLAGFGATGSVKAEETYINPNTNEVYIKNDDNTFSTVSGNGNLEQQLTDKTNTSKFLRLSDDWSIPSATYGQSVQVVLPVVNYSNSGLSDIVITPVTDASVSKWPFELESTGGSRVIKAMPAYHFNEDISALRQEVNWTFTTRDDVLTGYYPLTFDVTYTMDGQHVTDTITSYVKTTGAPGSGSTENGGGAANSSKPRMIVTGFTTEPATVFAGDTFTVHITIENTSETTTISNALFDLQAVVQGKDEDTSYAAFLPTSGSSSVYMDTIGPNTTKQIDIEMQAKSDLVQKPYVLTVNMKYDAGTQFDISDTANVSIPIKQSSKMETSSMDIMPDSIMVGEQSNVMFSIYNTGKTTLYNVKTRFEGDTIEGGDTYLGNLTSGSTGNVDAMITGIAETMDEGLVKAIVSYEDESGNVTEEEKEFTLFVSAAFIDEGAMDFTGEMMPEPEGGGVPVGPIVVAVVIAAVAAGVFFWIRKKKQKAKKQLEEDLDGIDEIETSDAKEAETTDTDEKAETAESHIDTQENKGETNS